jgi:hypothetical protein
MNGKKTFGVLAWFAAGLAAGYLIAQRIGDCFCVDEETEKHSGKKPPLHVKPVPIVKRSIPISGPDETDGATE